MILVAKDSKKPLLWWKYMDKLKTIVNTYFNLITKAGIILVIFSAFFLFTNLTTEFYDTAKFLVLMAVTGVLLILFALKSTVDNKVTFVRTPLDLPLLLLLAVGIISTFLSPAPFVSLLGNQIKLHGSLVSLIVYILFYFVLVNSLKNQKAILRLLFFVKIGAVPLSLITLLTFFGAKILPAPWVHEINFTPTGSSFSTTAILAMLVPLVAARLIANQSLIPQLINAALLTLIGVTLALTGSLPTWIAAVAGLILTFLVSPLSNLRNLNDLKPVRIISLIVPLATVLLVVFLSLVPPLKGANNPLYSQSKNFPREINLGLINSWKIAISSFRDAPFWGSGPGTFLFDFTNYKPIEFNSSKNWNIRFDSAFNEYLQVLATLGGVGLIALLSLTALYISSASPVILNAARENTSDEKVSLAISGLTFFIMLALHPATLVLWVFGLILLAAFAGLNAAEVQGHNWSGVKQVLLKMTGEETIRVEALPSILLTVFLGLVLFAFFFGGKFALADYHHRIALNAAAQNQGVVAYNELIISEKLNPVSDLYRTDLAQINFALANAIALAKGPTAASPSGTLTDQDKQNIQVLLQQSINEGRIAVTLNPRSALNWEILGLLYRQIAGVAQNALISSLDSYGRAIFQDPLNPNLRLSVGGVYYAIQNYDLAIRFFTDAINLKPDFANGYYNLSVALRDKGDLTTAQAAAEKVLTLVDKDSQDYKVANDYLTDLKNKRESAVKPPASETTGALQEEGLPKIVDVGKPPTKIATPSAVKKPNATPEPTPTP